MTSSPDDRHPVIQEMYADLQSRISPHIEHIKFLRGHGEHKGWSMGYDEDHENRFRCGCGEWLDDKEEAEADGDL